MREVRLGEPAIHPGRHALGDRRRPLGGLERLGLRGAALEDGAARRLLRLDHDDGGPGLLRHGLGQGAEEAALRRQCQRSRRPRQGRGAHDQQLGRLGLAQDRRGDAGALDEQRSGTPSGVMTHEGPQGALRLGPHGGVQLRPHDVERDHLGVQTAAERVGEADGQLRMGAATHGDEDAVHVVDTPLLDHGDVARRIAHHLVDGRAEDGLGRPRACRWRPAPAEDDEIRLVLRGGLDDALGRPAPDAHRGAQLDVVGRELQHALQQAASLAGAGRPLGERHPLRDLDDAQRGERAAVLHDRRADAHEVGRGARVGQRQEDAAGQAGAAPHEPARQRSTNSGLTDSKTRAWRSTTASASSPLSSAVSRTWLATRPK